ncbi:hypothetical protein [Kitasatospora sp. MAP5-34]|uniref:hypothetical protein n=1 Tax=Kitasatospora sp. MAP5-34 TaxID=3035102 RepID=UPI0024756C36|nr:hypothetical protein [Kitasatospora sp. MAP5-34]MDH6579856.1 hypothetical protein [Kitasatospora sp. MAP5-34]
MFLTTCAAHAEIARNLGTAGRLREVERLAQTLEVRSPTWMDAVNESRAIFNTATPR